MSVFCKGGGTIKTAAERGEMRCEGGGQGKETRETRRKEKRGGKIEVVDETKHAAKTNKQKKKKRNRQTAGESKGKEVGGRDETGGKKEREAKIN